MNKKYFSLLPLITRFLTYMLPFILTAFLLLSCNEEPEERSSVNAYFDVKGFVETQIAYLNKAKPVVNKAVELSGEREKRVSREIDWKKELELFVQADLNKPAYVQSYTTAKPDSFTLEYTIKPGEELAVRYLKITLDTLKQKPVSIFAQIRSENKLYQSEKNIELFCTEKNKFWAVTSYRIKGFQKLVTMDKKPFDIQAKIGL